MGPFFDSHKRKELLKVARTLTMDQKWEKVQEHCADFGIRFKHRIDDRKITFLFNHIVSLARLIEKHQRETKPKLLNFLEDDLSK